MGRVFSRARQTPPQSRFPRACRRRSARFPGLVACHSSKERASPWSLHVEARAVCPRKRWRENLRSSRVDPDTGPRCRSRALDGLGRLTWALLNFPLIVQRPNPRRDSCKASGSAMWEHWLRPRRTSVQPLIRFVEGLRYVRCPRADALPSFRTEIRRVRLCRPIPPHQGLRRRRALRPPPPPPLISAIGDALRGLRAPRQSRSPSTSLQHL